MTNAISSLARAPRDGTLKTFLGVRPPERAHPDRHRSWVSPDAIRAKQVLFISDPGLDDVYMYSLPKIRLIGTLTGFSEPQGMCSDTKGNVFVANTGTNQVLRISRAGKITAKYDDTYGYAVGCAYDPATGNLAVTNIFGFSGAGQVLVFETRFPSVAPIVLSNPNQYYYYFVGYDPKSILWVDGKDSSGKYMVSSCGASTCGNVYLYGGTLYFPGAVQWNRSANNWVLFDQICGGIQAACSYPVMAGDILGTPTFYQNYAGRALCDMIQGVLGSNLTFVVGSDNESSCDEALSSSNRWAYAAGGNPTNYKRYSDKYSSPNGAAISKLP